MDNSFRRDRGKQNLHRTDYLPGNNDWLILTRLLPSNDNNKNNLSRTLPIPGLR
jgi:hypothetical protein